MIADRHRAHAILTGQITQMRLPHKPWTRTSSQRLPKTGQHQPIRRDNYLGDIAGHVTITGCTLGAHHHKTLTPDNLNQLGYPDLTTYVASWLLDRDVSWIARRAPTDTGPHATTIDAAIAALPYCSDELADRWHHRWAEQPVWIVTFEPAHDIPIYLAGPPRIKYTTRHDGTHVIDDGVRDQDRGYRGDGVRDIPSATELQDRGYTTLVRGALTSAGDVFDIDTLRPHWADTARQRHTNARGRRAIANDMARNLRAA